VARRRTKTTAVAAAARRRRRQEQQALPFRSRGGARPGAGRKPKGPRRRVPHRLRAPRSAREPVHVTMRVLAGLPRLRVRPALRILWRCMAAGRDRFGFRLVQFSIQGNHVHLIAEAPDRRALARGMQGLAVRFAKNLNKGWGRAGTVFADRYHDHVLRTPREVRAALCYVLNNALHHGHVFVREGGTDPCSSAPWFYGWLGLLVPRAPPGAPLGWAPVVPARTWLLTIGWRRHGRIAVDEKPGARARRRQAGRRRDASSSDTAV
jgi:REP element-mobilizing transposase RayT